jgi:hypothetical protein
MSRKLRIEYPEAMYHVMNRGDQREDIFRDDQDRQKFLPTLGEACAKTEPVSVLTIETLTNFYSNRQRMALSIQQPTGAWTNGLRGTWPGG